VEVEVEAAVAVPLLIHWPPLHPHRLSA